MPQRKVFVVWSNRMFLESLKVILQHPGLVWAGAVNTNGELLPELAAAQPDVVLVEGDEKDNTSRVMHILRDSRWSMRIIGLSMQDNEMSLYDIEQGTIQQTEDLIRLILRGAT